MKKNNSIKIAFGKSNGFYLVVFFIFFISAIIISISLKAIDQFNNAHFSGTSINTLVVTQQDSYLMRLDNQSGTLSVLRIDNTKIDTENLTAASVKTGVPIHAAMILKDETDSIDSVVKTGEMVRLLITNKISLIQLNQYDALKFANSAQKIDTENKTVKEIKNYVDNRSVISQIDSELYELFRDPEIINERTSIEVVNATSQNGLATAVAQMLENGGYTVVGIRSSEIQKSVIQTNIPDTLTVQTVKKIFSFPVAPSGRNAVSDIRIVIGDDSLN